jgi:hypothetical protein
VKNWPECSPGEYNPACCRFPKSCSCESYDEALVTDDQLEPWGNRGVITITVSRWDEKRQEWSVWNRGSSMDEALEDFYWRRGEGDRKLRIEYEREDV